jgi:ribosomal protein L37E
MGKHRLGKEGGRGPRLFGRSRRDDLFERSFRPCRDCGADVYVLVDECRDCGSPAEARVG